MKSILASMPAELAVGASVVAIAAAATGVYRWSSALYRRTVGSRRDVTSRLNQLASGVTTRWIEERLGAPAFARGAHLGSVPGGEAVTELIYRTRHAWVQILADRDGAVVRLSITVTDPRFRFGIRDLTNTQLDVKLGHSRFADIRTSYGEPEGHSLRVGAHNYEYSEAYYFGNPGNYQHYVLSFNDIGAGNFDASAGGGPQWCQDGVLLSKGSPNSDDPGIPIFDPKASYAERFRSRTTINTLTILGPWRKPSNLAEPRGPDSHHVRVLLADPRERRRRQRLVRRRNRTVLREARRQVHEASAEKAGQLASSEDASDSDS